MAEPNTIAGSIVEKLDNLLAIINPKQLRQQIAHSLKLKLIVEAIEIQKQFDFFVQHQCDAIQGNFLIAVHRLEHLFNICKNFSST